MFITGPDFQTLPQIWQWPCLLKVQAATIPFINISNSVYVKACHINTSSVLLSWWPLLTEVLVMPHWFLLDSGDSGGFWWILEECKLAGGPANIAILGVAHSGGIEAFWNWYRNVPWNSPERNATGICLPEWYLIYNIINMFTNNYNIDY